MFNLTYAHFSNAYRRYAHLDKDGLFNTLGWADKVGSSGYAHNGAVLTSLALLSSGVPLSGSLRIEAGPLAGGKAFNGANRLADWLSVRHEAPEMLPLDKGLAEVAYQLFGRRGIVAFMQGSGPQGGLIGLLDGRNAGAMCRAAEIKHPLEVRFWPLP